MSTPDETKFHGLWKLGGTYSPNGHWQIHFIWYFLMVFPPFLTTVSTGFIHPGLTLFGQSASYHEYFALNTERYGEWVWWKDYGTNMTNMTWWIQWIIPWWPAPIQTCLFKPLHTRCRNMSNMMSFAVLALLSKGHYSCLCCGKGLGEHRGASVRIPDVLHLARSAKEPKILCEVSSTSVNS